MVHVRHNQNAKNDLAFDDDSKKDSIKRRLLLWWRQGYVAWIFALSFLLLFLTTLPARMMSMISDSMKTMPESSYNSNTTQVVVIPDCDASPWKPHEDLVGTCPGIRPTTAAASAAAECARYCCAEPTCITWQWRRDKGCLTGGDVRIGHEKDGPAAYCSNHPPYKWQGQFVLVANNNGKGRTRDPTACSTETWNPQQHQGQCFGLGDVRKNVHSARECMQTCCQNEACGAWQYHAELGCFYGPRMFACQPSGDPVAFEPYVGRRKLQSSRSYS